MITNQFQISSEVFLKEANHIRNLNATIQASKGFLLMFGLKKKGMRFSTTEQCTKEYSSCSLSVDKLINKKMLHFWQTLSQRFAIQLQDE